MSERILLILGFAFAVSLLATGLVRRYALQKNILDVPNTRSSHLVATPRGGGVAIVLSFYLALFALSYDPQFDAKGMGALFVGGLAIAIVGFLDDRRPLPAHLRFGVHLLAAIFVVLLVGGLPEVALVQWGLHNAWVGMAIAVVALVWVTNLFNFMDGIDGIAGVEVIFVSVAGAWLNWQVRCDTELTAATLCLAAACAGFLYWNWPPARIFMGDVGSGFVGFTIAVLGLIISKQGALPIEVWVILGGVFVVDATVTLIRRLIRGDRWFEAHCTHAYQLLAQRWNSHLPVTISLGVVNCFWLFPWAWMATKYPRNAVLCLVAALAPLVGIALVVGAGKKLDLNSVS